MHIYSFFTFRSFVRECRTVTVAFSHFKSSAIGVPTMALRPGENVFITRGKIFVRKTTWLKLHVFCTVQTRKRFSKNHVDEIPRGSNVAENSTCFAKLPITTALAPAICTPDFLIKYKHPANRFVN